jgi:hypothetical protein
MIVAILSSETSVLTKATVRHIPEDGIPLSSCVDSFSSPSPSSACPTSFPLFPGGRETVLFWNTIQQHTVNDSKVF